MHASSVHLSQKTTRSSRRHFLLGLVAAGLAYAAPPLTGLSGRGAGPFAQNPPNPLYGIYALHAAQPVQS